MIAFRSHRESILRLIISFLSVIQLQLALFFVIYLIASNSIIFMIPVSGVIIAVVLGFGRVFKGLFGIQAYAPATVLFHAVFLWGIYVYVIRGAVTFAQDAVMNLGFVLIIFGLYRIISSDPGIVAIVDSDPEKIPLSSPSESKLLSLRGLSSLARIRFCKSCNAYVLGFDHHCPAFGNCIGRNNHRLFITLLVGFIVTESSYVLCAIKFISKSEEKIKTKSYLPRTLVISTLIFSLLQIIWQVIFLLWHIYCICVNIRTDEWINWRSYPEFHGDSNSQIGQPSPDLRFRNPHDNGVISNLKEFLLPCRSSFSSFSLNVHVTV